MHIKKILLFLFFSVIGFLLSACANQKLPGIMLAETPSGMGVNYLLGRGVPQNNEKAFYYFKQAADQDDAFAQNEVAYMYAAGKGVQQDYKMAFHYYQKAADNDLASAQYSLGLLYANGLGVAKNAGFAETWFKKSAAHHFEPAIVALKHDQQDKA